MVSGLHPPVPFIHNEFAHLLAGDTFASGRSTNPTHPLYPFFEAIHILHFPSYASKLPPGVGAFLAIGKVGIGNAIAGIWLATALAIAAIYWALRGYFREKWALLGTTLVFLDIGIVHHWSQSFRGATIAVLGGAIAFGAIVRIVGQQRVRDVILMAVGLGIMANTRPLEGLFFALPLGVVLAVWFFRTASKKELQHRAIKVALPMTFALAIVFGSMGVYNQAVTGNPFQFPYSLYEREYAAIPSFLWQQERSQPNLTHAHIQGYSDWQVQRFREIQQQGAIQFIYTRTREILQAAMQSWFGWFLLLVPLTFPFWYRRPWMQLAAVCTVLMLSSHYWVLPVRSDQFAPGTIAVILLMTAALEGIAKQRSRLLAGGLTLLLIGYLSFNIATRFANPNPFNGGVQNSARHSTIAALKNQPGRDLVFVQFSDRMSIHAAWVYNGANIDASEVIFANDMGAEKNQTLIDYYGDRQVWLLFVDEANRLRIDSYPRS